MTSWLRQNKKDTRQTTPMETVLDFFTYLCSGDKDTSKLILLLDTNLSSTNINTKGDIYSVYGIQSYVNFFKKYYHECRNYHKFDLHQLNITPVFDAKNIYNIHIKGDMTVLDSQFGYWKVIELNDKYTIELIKIDIKYKIKNITSNADGNFIKFVFD